MSIKITISDEERALLNIIASHQNDMVERVQTWSAINSGSHNRAGLDAMRANLRDAFASLGGQIAEPDLAQGTYVTAAGEQTHVEYAPALEITVRPDAPVQIVLTGHYDTVFPADFHFQSATWTDDETLNGPGVADMKGGIIVMIEALKALEQYSAAHKVGYTVLLSPDEEIGSPGSAPRLAELGRRSHVGLTFEPALADGSLAGARKGSGNFALIIKGRAAHAGREHHLGRNAITAMARFAAAVDALNGQREGVTFNMAKIDGGGATNIVPELAVGRFNVRMIETEDLAWITAQIDNLVADVNTEDGISAELTGGFSRPPKPMAPANAQIFDWVKQAGALLGQSIKWSMSGGVCEGNNLWASGCPNVDTLGVRGGDIHSDREYVKVASFTERAQLAALILMKIAGGEFNAATVKEMAMADLASSTAAAQ
ncbi:hydrolase [Robiginitomaculum antarcticum]|uniref:hydrolase n=1 Tax=Robiginitomaculum antarcticum TaxID=437507 RepID=UPI00037F9CCE|nr:hydrolase [Robiginitomaculum antarcticum]